MKPFVSFNQVGHRYPLAQGGHMQALTEVSFDIHRHEFVAVVGPSGCGKSTLLRLLSGLLSPSEGKVEVFNQQVTQPRDDVGIVFQKPTLLPWKSVLDNVLFPLHHKYGKVTDKDRAYAKQLINTVGLNDFIDRLPDQLSGGMQQRVGIARALLLDPDILIMDEPFSALDALTREEMGFELLRIWEEKPKTVLFITHSISEAVLLADKVLVMSARPGRLLEQIAIELPRPRSLDTMQIPAFSNYTRRIRAHIYGNNSQSQTQSQPQADKRSQTLAV
ncbi:ABC transporter ATP-binding protein [Cellvibrio sp. NN19]|uniref:ABC transporter ATP-binding protein n=1 Tax=Cellvibrio chitinivorans TaxID=3102792 RepID=UPI002B40319C|nr:ABC transporter ATP-binding protein [Cellvibrio sp. NN19]